MKEKIVVGLNRYGVLKEFDMSTHTSKEELQEYGLYMSEKVQQCCAKSPKREDGSHYLCTRTKGHDGPHVSYAYGTDIFRCMWTSEDVQYSLDDELNKMKELLQ